FRKPFAIRKRTEPRAVFNNDGVVLPVAVHVFQEKEVGIQPKPGKPFIRTLISEQRGIEYASVLRRRGFLRASTGGSQHHRHRYTYFLGYFECHNNQLNRFW